MRKHHWLAANLENVCSEARCGLRISLFKKGDVNDSLLDHAEARTDSDFDNSDRLTVTSATVSSATDSVHGVFKYVAVTPYSVYVAFFLLCIAPFGDRISTVLAAPAPLTGAWPLGGVMYASYNIIGVVVILPVLRNLGSRRDAILAGLLCGPFYNVTGATLFHIHDGCVSGNRFGYAAGRSFASTAELPTLPRSIPGHDLGGIVGKRRRARARDL